jgi:hypothetical protein
MRSSLSNERTVHWPLLVAMFLAGGAVQGCADRSQEVEAAVLNTSVFQGMARSVDNPAMMIESQSDEYAIVAIGEDNFFTFNRWATLRVDKSGRTERLVRQPDGKEIWQPVY